MKATITEFHEDGRVKKVRTINEFVINYNKYGWEDREVEWQKEQNNLKEYEVVWEDVVFKLYREKFPQQFSESIITDEQRRISYGFELFSGGYKAHRESHPFTKEDMVGFAEWINVQDIVQDNSYIWHKNNPAFDTYEKTTDQLLFEYINRDLGKECEIEVIDEEKLTCKIVKP